MKGGEHSCRYVVSLSFSLQEGVFRGLLSREIPPYTWARKARGEGGDAGSWGGCQLQPQGADGDAALGLEKSSEWEALKESSGIEKGWEQGGEEGKEFLIATLV